MARRAPSRTVEAFDFIERIGEGQYGLVWRALERGTGRIVALKRVRLDVSGSGGGGLGGMCITLVRELKVLKELKHTNIVALHEVVTGVCGPLAGSYDSICLVFEFLDMDLRSMLDHKSFPGFRSEQVKCYARQILQALRFCHRNNVIHRDLKPENLLVSASKGLVKLADFGLAKPLLRPEVAPTGEIIGRQLTNRVVTLWYRSPELLLGARDYGPAVDIWSAGCVIAELYTRRPLFRGDSELKQLEQVTKACGSPNESTWPDCNKLEFYETLKKCCVQQNGSPHRRMVKQLFSNVASDALDLIDRMLSLAPHERPSAADALDANYFYNEPAPLEPAQMPNYSYLLAPRKVPQQIHHHQHRGKPQRNSVSKASSEDSSAKRFRGENAAERPQQRMMHV